MTAKQLFCANVNKRIEAKQLFRANGNKRIEAKQLPRANGNKGGEAKQLLGATDNKGDEAKHLPNRVTLSLSLSAYNPECFKVLLPQNESHIRTCLVFQTFYVEVELLGKGDNTRFG